MYTGVSIANSINQYISAEYLIDDFTLDKTLDDLKQRISRLDNPTNDEYEHIQLFFYGGLTIEDASNTTLGELFGEKEIIQIDYESVDAAKIDVFVQDPNLKRYVFESMSKRPVAVGETGNINLQLIVWKSNFILETQFRPLEVFF